MSWPAVFAVARAELRRRLVALVLLGIIAGLTGAVTISALQLARRTDTAYARLERSTVADDMRGQTLGSTREESLALAERIAALPVVERAGITPVGVGRVVGDEVNYLGVISLPARRDVPIQPKLIAGRQPDPDDRGEVLVADWFVRANDEVDIGTEVTVRFLTRAEFFRFDAGDLLEGLGPEVDLEVVGIVRLPGSQSDFAPFLAGPALMREHPDAFDGPVGVLVQLTDEPGAADAVLAEVDEINAEVDLGPEGQEFSAAAFNSGAMGDAAAATTTNVITTGLLAFAAVAAVAGGVALAQAAARQHALAATDHLVESALGLTRSQRVASRTISSTVPAAVAAVTTAAGGLVGATVEPLGGVRFFEPNPGWAPNVAMLAIGSVGAALISIVIAALSALRADVERPVRTVREARVARARIAQAGANPPVVVGLRFGFERGAGRSTVPVRSSLAAVVLGVGGIASVVVFAASLHRLVTTPLRYGHPVDVSIVDAGPEQVSELVADGRTSTVFDGAVTDARLDGQLISVVGIDVRKGELAWELVSGRPPATPDEIVLGTRVSDQLGRGTGDTITARLADGEERELAVTGVGVLPTFSSAELGRNAAVTLEALERLAVVAPFGEAGASVRDGVDADAYADELAEKYEVSTVELPSEVKNLDDLGQIPIALGAFLGALAAVALAHSLVVASRRRRHDVAMLRVLGFTTSQTRAMFAVMGAALATAGALVGLPVGVAIGSAVWRVVAEGAAVAGDVNVRWMPLALVVAGALLVAIAIAARPAWQATRHRPAQTLRSE